MIAAIPRPALLLALALALPPAPARTQAALFAQTAPNGTHHLVAVDEGTLLPTLLFSGVTFLPVDLAGAAFRDRLRIDRAVLAGADGPAPHVRLPSLGSLYRVHHDGTTALLQVQPDGSVALRAAVADAGGEAGLLPDLAVDPSGTSVLLATSPAAGGNVLWLDLGAPGPGVDLTAALPPLAVQGSSLRLGQTRAWFVAEGALHRVDLLAGTSEVVALQLAPGDVLLPELACSENGDACALLSEDALGQRHVHVVQSAGPAQRVTSSAGTIDAPSLLHPAGPLLAVSDDGGQVAWRRLLQAREVFVAPVTQAAPATQVTADATFADTIDNAGILGFVNGKLLFAAGEVSLDEPAVAVGSADIFLHDPATGTTQNLTATSGVASPPFLSPGELEVKGALLDPLAQRLLLHVDPVGGDDGLLAVSLAAPGLTTVLGGLSAPPVIERAGTDVLLASTIAPAVGPVHQELHLLAPEGDPAGLVLLGAVDADLPLLFDRVVSDRTGTQAALVASLDPALELPVLVDLVGRGAAPAWDGILAVSPTLAYTPLGRLSAGLGAAGGPFVLVGFDAPGLGVVWPLPVLPGFPLEG